MLVDGGGAASREYLGGTLVLATTLEGPGGSARLLDCMPFEDPLDPATEHRMLLRVVEGLRGSVEVRFEVVPRFDYGEVAPWIRHHGRGVYSAIGGDDALVCSCDAELEPDGERALAASFTVRAGERVRLMLAFRRPQQLDSGEVAVPPPDALDQALEDTIRAWREWSERSQIECADADGVRRSALVLKALTYRPTGALVAARHDVAARVAGARRGPQLGLPLQLDPRRVLAARSPHRARARRARPTASARFIERSAAGARRRPADLYGVGGERRIGEHQLEPRRLPRVAAGARGQRRRRRSSSSTPTASCST